MQPFMRLRANALFYRIYLLLILWIKHLYMHWARETFQSSISYARLVASGVTALSSRSTLRRTRQRCALAVHRLRSADARRSPCRGVDEGCAAATRVGSARWPAEFRSLARSMCSAAAGWSAGRGGERANRAVGTRRETETGESHASIPACSCAHRVVSA